MTGEGKNLIERTILGMIAGQRRHSQLEENSLDEQTKISYLFQILSVEGSRVDQQKKINHQNDNHREGNRFVLQEIPIGEDFVPIHRFGKNRESTGEASRMRGETLRFVVTGRESHRQSVRLTFILIIEIKTSGSEQTNFVIRREMSFFIAQRTNRTRIQFSQTEDHRLMVQSWSIANEIRVETRWTDLNINFIEEMKTRGIVHRRDILQKHRRNDDLKGMSDTPEKRRFIPVLIDQRQRHRSGQIRRQRGLRLKGEEEVEVEEKRRTNSSGMTKIWVERKIQPIWKTKTSIANRLNLFVQQGFCRQRFHRHESSGGIQCEILSNIPMYVQSTGQERHHCVHLS
jgi:hypothetical protein